MNAIVTSAHQLRVEQIKPFVESASRYDCKVIVIAGRLDPWTIEYLQRYNCVISRVGIEDNYYKLHFNNYRFLHIHKMFENRELEFDNLLLCDMRDVLIQSDPFTLPQSDRICCAVEQTRVSQSRANSKWILRTFGPIVWWKMRHWQTVCAGTIQGSKDSLKPLVKKMNKIIRRKPYIGTWSGLDQAVLNKLVFDSPQDFHLCSNYQGPFLTLDSEKRILHDKYGNFLDWNTEQRIPVVHQYDRVPWSPFYR